MRELVEAYALAVDRKEPAKVASLFSTTGRLVSLFGPGSPQSPLVRQGREKITSVLEAGLAVYVSTTHIVGSHATTLSGTSANGETSCLAHHVYERDGERRLLVMAVRYEDEYVIEDGKWRFGERRLTVDWQQDTPLGET